MNLAEPEIAPFDLPTPKPPQERTKHEVDRTTPCGYTGWAKKK